mmetsp:Transcript_68023/g.175341  ORF Transcript_68023/g.175341 Transcript_68023/m.175341 type:complete len:574 (+) Transcript_68023:83-1804(+)
MRDGSAGGGLSAAAAPYYPPGSTGGSNNGRVGESGRGKSVLSLADFLDDSGGGTREAHGGGGAGKDEANPWSAWAVSPYGIGWDGMPAPPGRVGPASQAVGVTPGSFARPRWQTQQLGHGGQPAEMPKGRQSWHGAIGANPNLKDFTSTKETNMKVARAAAQLRELLNFYFEPFNLQHNRYLLDLIARHAGPSAEAGPWLVETLKAFRFSFDDLLGLGRIAPALQRLSEGEALSRLGTLKHLGWTGDGRLQLVNPPEVRSFVAAKKASKEAVAATSRYLAAVREHRGRAPSGMLSILSYALGQPMNDDSLKGQQSQAQLKRQLLLHHTDVICLQGLDPKGSGSSLASTLVEEGYQLASCQGPDGEANAIFWDSTRLHMTGQEELGAALALDFEPWEDFEAAFRIVCMRPTVPESNDPGNGRLIQRVPNRSGAIIVCADCTLLGGSECASVLEELATMRSLPYEVLGDEIQAPVCSARPDGGGEAVQGPASGLNRLHQPDGMFFEGLTPTMALSGHTERYLATMAADQVPSLFPAFRVPIVAAFDWRGGRAADSSPAVEGACAAAPSASPSDPP